MNRIAVYVYYDTNGIVQDHAWFCISKLLIFFNRTVVVVNGSLKEDQAEKLRALGAEIIVRKNEGYDFWAYRAGIKHVGFSSLKSADELLLLNSSVYGPIFPIDEVFSKFKDRTDVDLWGLTKWHGKSYKDHIQSYFVVFRKKILDSKYFEDYWEKLPPLKTRQEAIDLCESKLTYFFAKNGFDWDVACGDYFNELTSNPSMLAPMELLKLKIPFIKRKVFCADYFLYVDEGFSNWTVEICDWLQKNSEFKPQLLIKDLINTANPTETGRSMHRTFILSDSLREDRSQKIVRVAAVIFVYFKDLILENLSLIDSFPEETQFYLVSSKEDVLNEYKKILSGERFHFRIQENRGRNESAYFVTCRDVLSDFDYVCLIHDKKSVHISPQYIVSSFRKYLYSCLARNEIYVKNIIDVFEKNPLLGMLYPPEPRFGPWKQVVPYSNKKNLIAARNLYEKLELKVPFDLNPEFPVGSMFWVRKDALSALFKHDWKFADFPGEPLPVDGTLLHALERLYPTIVQNSGYYSGQVMPVSIAKVYVDNLIFNMNKGIADINAIDFKDKHISSSLFKKICKAYFSEKIKNILH